MANAGSLSGCKPDSTTAKLELYDLNPPCAHFNPNLPGEGIVPRQPLAQATPTPPVVDALLTPLSMTPLTIEEQDVFRTVLEDISPPFALENPGSPSLSCSFGAPTSAEEVSCAGPQTVEN